MTISSDFTAAGLAQKALTVTTTSTLITGTSGLAGAAIPGKVTHMALQPADGKVYWNVGTASASTALVPADGLVINAHTAPALNLIQLYSPTGATCLCTFGGNEAKLVLGGGDTESYDVGEPFTVLIDDSVLTAALSDPTPSTTKAESVGAAAHGIIDTRGKAVARIMFGGVGSDTSTMNYQVIGWSQAVGQTAEGWIPRVIANGLAALGTDVYAVAGVGGTTNKWCDLITDTVLDKATIFIPGDNLRAVLEFPTFGCERIEVQTNLGNATKADCFIQFADPKDDANAFLATIDADTASMTLDLAELTSAPVVKAPLQVTKVLAGTEAPIAIVASETFATAVYLQAARVDGDNASDIFIGLSDVVSGTDNYIKLTPGATWQYVCRPGTKVDLQVFKIDGEDSPDGVQGYYEPA